MLNVRKLKQDFSQGVLREGKELFVEKKVFSAKILHLSVIGLIGFDGGKLLPLSDAKICIPSSKYAIVESAHDAICHLITTYFEESIKDES